jgi:hypothetical protein
MKMIMETSLNTNILEYIVPIRFRSKLLGTGIIHKSLLITAAHVVEELEKEKIEFSFVYHHQHFAMNWNCKLFYEYDKEKKRIYKDLAIFKTNIISGGLPIEPENNYDEAKALLCGYNDENNDITLNISEGNIRLKPFNDGRTCIAMNKNTLLLMNVQPLFICNSGGPLISADNSAIGILSAGNIDIHFARFISSSHILEVFSKDDCCREALIEYEKSRYL